MFDGGAIGTAVCDLLTERGHRCVRVLIGDRFHRESDTLFQLDPSSSNDYERLMRELGSKEIRGIVHAWSAPSSHEEPSVERIEAAQVVGSDSVLYTLQGVTSAKPRTPPKLWIVTRGAQAVEEDLSNPAQSPLWGLGAVITLEHPELRCVRVDLSVMNPLKDVTVLCDELERGVDDEVAVRNGVRYVARLTERRGTDSANSSGSPVVIDAESNVLVTGGLGALGLEVARWLVERGARHVTLVGRRAPEPSAQAVIHELEQAGAEMLVLQADVSNREDVQSVFEQADKRALVRGIVHAAGILDDGVLLQQNAERFRRTMAPKVAGTWNLHEATLERDLDFFVCFSSAASLLGSRGQGNYAAANAFLDGLAGYRRARGLPALSINWGPWGEVGMAATMDERATRRMHEQGWEPLQTKEGMEILGELMADGEIQVGVLPIQWSRFLTQYSTPARPSFFEGVTPVTHQKDEDTSSSTGFAQRLQQASPEEREKLLVEFLTQEVAHIVGLGGSTHLEANLSFNELGVDSLMHMELRNQINDVLSVSLPMADFINSRNIQSLVDLVEQQMALASLSGAADDGDGDGDASQDMEEITL